MGPDAICQNQESAWFKSKCSRFTYGQPTLPIMTHEKHQSNCPTSSASLVHLFLKFSISVDRALLDRPILGSTALHLFHLYADTQGYCLYPVIPKWLWRFSISWIRWWFSGALTTRIACVCVNFKSSNSSLWSTIDPPYDYIWGSSWHFARILGYVRGIPRTQVRPTGTEVVAIVELVFPIAVSLSPPLIITLPLLFDYMHWETLPRRSALRFVFLSILLLASPLRLFINFSLPYLLVSW